MRLVIALSILAGLVVLNGCSSLLRSSRDWAPLATSEAGVDYQTPLAEGLNLTFPKRPDYPVAETLIQTVIGQYADHRTVFQAVLDLSPDNVTVVVTAASGPRILTINWTSEGIREDRTILAPEGLTSLNILGDIVLTLWPPESVQPMLPDSVVLTQSGKVRTIASGENDIIRIEETVSDAGARRHEFHNLTFGYHLSIITTADQ